MKSLLCTAALLGPLSVACGLQAREVEPVNYLPNPYETVRNWGTLPDGRAWGSVPAVDIDPDGRSLWVLDRCGTLSWQSAGISSCAGQDVAPVMKFDTRTGQLLQAFGSGVFLFPHPMHVDPAGNVWVADSRAATREELARFPSAAGKGHQLVKFSPDGRSCSRSARLAWPATHRSDSISRWTSRSQRTVTSSSPKAITPAHRSAAFRSSRRTARSVGRGAGPARDRASFAFPHGMAFDAQGRLLVADRGNHRVQVFDQDGTYLDSYRQFGRPSDVFVDRDGLLYAIDSESGQRLNPGWRKGVRIGRASDGEALYFIPPHFIEDTFLFPSGITVYSEGAAGDGVTVDADGNIYAADVGTGNPIVGITKYIRRFELGR